MFVVSRRHNSSLILSWGLPGRKFQSLFRLGLYILLGYPMVILNETQNWTMYILNFVLLLSFHVCIIPGRYYR